MEKSRFRETWIVAILGAADVDMKGKEGCRKRGIADAIGRQRRTVDFYRNVFSVVPRK